MSQDISDTQIKINKEALQYLITNSVSSLSDLIGNCDVQLSEWKIISVQLSNEPEQTQHIFGYDLISRTYVISSAILEDTDLYIRTRSRKYFKLGDKIQSFNNIQLSYLKSFLRAWGMKDTEITSIIENNT